MLFRSFLFLKLCLGVFVYYDVLNLGFLLDVIIRIQSLAPIKEHPVTPTLLTAAALAKHTSSSEYSIPISQLSPSSRPHAHKHETLVQAVLKHHSPLPRRDVSSKTLSPKTSGHLGHSLSHLEIDAGFDSDTTVGSIGSSASYDDLSTAKGHIRLLHYDVEHVLLLCRDD